MFQVLLAIAVVNGLLEPHKKDVWSEKTPNARFWTPTFSVPSIAVPAAVPAAWTCLPGFYDNLDGCDCQCGVWDPDCDVDGQDLYGCPSHGSNPEEICVYNGSDPPTCQKQLPTVPETWTCSAAWYGTKDGCDCEYCGAWDPDCDSLQDPLQQDPLQRDEQDIFGCPSVAFTCFDPIYEPPRCVPDAWTCNPNLYNAGGNCDCNCGAWDPDCDVDGAFLQGCPSHFYNCVNNGGLNPPSCEEFPATFFWTCSEDHYDAIDGCDCNCGAWDPDCVDPYTRLYGCPSQAYACVDNGYSNPPSCVDIDEVLGPALA